MTEQAMVYVVDDDKDLREAILDTLEDEKIAARGFAAASEAIKVLDPEWGGIIVSDIRMPGLSGIEFLKVVKKSAPEVPFILITGHGDVATAISAMKAGAYDFLEKPARPQYLVEVVRRALNMRRLQLENSKLRQMIASGGSLNSRIIGRSTSIKNCRRDILAIAPLNVDVLIQGETGTGKCLAARCIHDLSPRADQEFTRINCVSVTAKNIEKILAGGDDKSPKTNGGTLFFDELNSLDETAQVKMMRYLEDGKNDKNKPRIIAGIESEPKDLIENGKLRADLYYLINVANISLPNLKNRGKDIFTLLDYFISEAASRHNLKIPDVKIEYLSMLKKYSWPGNVRELRNVAEKLVIGLEVVLGEQSSSENLLSNGYDAALQKFEFNLLREALLQAGGRKGEAANLLGIPRKRFYLRLKHHGLNQ
ncbi:hypothetical protein MNBD_ALPHA11-149 [hydrothermal vent metagenome]|uniref:Uncharacterized protein n=1 Tax=hydrothermal vent metagenome TaxID=652676 RepID=A0A3B0TUJ4_9ZZZZ